MRRIGMSLGIVLLIGAALGWVYRTELMRLWAVNHLFDEETIHANFQNMDDVFPSREVPAAAEPHLWPTGTMELPSGFEHDGRPFETEAFLAKTQTTGLLVVHDGTILLERYERGLSQGATHIGWSVSKSVVSALFGIALADGAIDDLMEPVTKYLPELKGSGYDGVAIKHVLQMSSGVGFNEDYGDPDSDINRMGRVIALGGDLLEFAGTLERARPPGTLQHYVSMDTQVLGEILVRTTGQSLADYTREKLWSRIGAEHAAFWTIDDHGMEMAFGGFNRESAGFREAGPALSQWWSLGESAGRPRRMGGRFGDARRAPISGPAPSRVQRMPWVTAINGGFRKVRRGSIWRWGVYNQMVYVDPIRRLVIAKNSANRAFQANNFESTRETVSFFRAIAKQLGGASLARTSGHRRAATGFLSFWRPRKLPCVS